MRAWNFLSFPQHETPRKADVWLAVETVRARFLEAFLGSKPSSEESSSFDETSEDENVRILLRWFAEGEIGLDMGFDFLASGELSTEEVDSDRLGWSGAKTGSLGTAAVRFGLETGD